MREFKFRAWLEYDKLDLKPMPPGMMYDKNIGDCFRWKAKGIGLISIMQYTGFTDMHGNEVYEGDILGYNNEPLDYLVVRWNNVKGGWYITRPTKDIIEWPLSKYFYAGSQVIILGNIYENPDMLE